MRTLLFKSLFAAPVTEPRSVTDEAAIAELARKLDDGARRRLGRSLGGAFAGSYACTGGVSAVVPVDLHIGGCPPSPTALLQGLLTLLEASARG